MHHNLFRNCKGRCLAFYTAIHGEKNWSEYNCFIMMKNVQSHEPFGEGPSVSGKSPKQLSDIVAAWQAVTGRQCHHFVCLFDHLPGSAASLEPIVAFWVFGRILKVSRHQCHKKLTTTTIIEDVMRHSSVDVWKVSYFISQIFTFKCQGDWEAY